ncbi:MAG: hypothetical protein AAF494_00825 [Pseudomonadota bacterium]
MTHRRAPFSTEQALQRIAGQISGGVDAMAEVAERQSGTIRAWMNPEREEQVTFECAIALDLAYQAAGGTGAPLFESYAAKLHLAEGRRFADRHRLLDYAQGVIKEGGEAHAAIVAAARPGATDEDHRIAHREAAEAYEKLRDILPLLEAMVSPGITVSYKTEGETALAQAP